MDYSSKIFVSCFIEDFGGLEGAKKRYPRAEIRLDGGDFEEEDLKRISDYFETSVFAYRGGAESSLERAEALAKAAEFGADYIDADVSENLEALEIAKKAAKEYGAKFIVSSHFFDKIPSKFEYLEMAEEAFDFGADIVKFVAAARNAREAAEVMSLYGELDASKLIAFASGERWKISRAFSLIAGAPIAYATAREIRATASGQFDYFEFKELIKALK